MVISKTSVNPRLSASPSVFFPPNLNRVSQPSTNQKRHFLQEIGIVGLRDDPPFTAEDYEAFPWHDARQQWSLIDCEYLIDHQLDLLSDVCISLANSHHGPNRTKHIVQWLGCFERTWLVGRWKYLTAEDSLWLMIIWAAWHHTFYIANKFSAVHFIPMTKIFLVLGRAA